MIVYSPNASTQVQVYCRLENFKMFSREMVRQIEDVARKRRTSKQQIEITDGVSNFDPSFEYCSVKFGDCRKLGKHFH